jgi:hypothetical protein
MEIELSPEDQERIQNIIKMGGYPDEQAVIHAALLHYKEVLKERRAAPQSEGASRTEEDDLSD